MNEYSRSVRKTAAQQKKATNITLPEDLVKDAKQLGINVSQACEIGLSHAVETEKSAKWRKENQKALEASNDYVQKNGLPLAKFRQF